MESDPLKPIFNMYTNKGPEMNGRSFVKVFKDAKLINKNLSTTGLDILFSKIKTKGKLKINFEQFQKGIKLAAKEGKMNHDAVLKKIISSKGPKFKGTKTDKVKLHDDKSQYTGVYSRGGPKTVDKGNGKIVDLQDLANRKKANIRGINKEIMKKSKKK